MYSLYNGRRNVKKNEVDGPGDHHNSDKQDLNASAEGNPRNDML